MSVFRPASVAALARWRGVALSVLPAAAAAMLAGPAALRGAPLALIVVAAGLALSAFLTREAYSRMRLRRAGGPGIVEVAEGRVAWFGPEHGGVADLDTLRSLEIAGGAWVLRGPEGAALRIPLDAERAEALLDAFAALPGFSSTRAAEAAASPAHALVWRRATQQHPSPAPLASIPRGPYISPSDNPEDGR